MSGFFLTLLLSFIIFNSPSEGSHESAVVVGTVYCDTCFHEDVSRATHFISGATVAVECKAGMSSSSSSSSRQSFRQEVKTNEHGEFKVELPFSVSKHVKKIKRCSVKVIESSEQYCAVASSATSSSLNLEYSRKQGTHVFSAGSFTFKPLSCSQKLSLVHNLERKLENKPPSSVVQPNQFLPPPVLPPNPLLPPPLLPPNPLLPPPLLPPNPLLPPPLLPPNPLQPSPAPLVPNPLQPPPAPVIPNPLQPPPAPTTPSLPPIPGLTPPPSPPSPPPAFPFPHPPFPIPPIPPFPGVPPAKSSP